LEVIPALEIEMVPLPFTKLIPLAQAAAGSTNANSAESTSRFTDPPRILETYGAGTAINRILPA